MVEKQVHAFEHKEDKHCTANAKHFHEQEHYCDICDFTLTDSNCSANAGYQCVAPVQQVLFSSLPENLYTPGAFQNLSSRAPPVA